MNSPVLALDQMLANLTDADLDAARAEMTLHRGATPPTFLRHRDVPEWIRLSVLDSLIRFFRGTADTCMHGPNPMRPEPVHAAAWRPGLVTCARCVHLFRLAGAADRTCDRCGRVCAGMPADGIHLCEIHLGALTFSFRLCSGCLSDTRAAS